LFGAGWNDGGDFLGHSDFAGNDRFNWNSEDNSWWSSPMNPFSTWRHFRNLSDVLPELEVAIESCNEGKFERLMHQAQDFYSHYRAGYREYGTGKHPATGHLLHGNRPDKNLEAWIDANHFTKKMLKKWDAKCSCKGGSW
jgi:hypothetical protein